MVVGVAVIVLVATVGAVVIATRSSGTYSARIGSYCLDDPYRLVAYVSLGFADPVVGYDAREEPDRVVLTVHARNRDFGPGTYKQLTASLASPVLISLKDQLGGRAVVNKNGAVIPRATQCLPGQGAAGDTLTSRPSKERPLRATHDRTVDAVPGVVLLATPRTSTPPPSLPLGLSVGWEVVIGVRRSTQVPGKQSQGVRAMSERPAPERERHETDRQHDQRKPGEHHEDAERASEQCTQLIHPADDTPRSRALLSRVGTVRGGDVNRGP